MSPSVAVERKGREPFERWRTRDHEAFVCAAVRHQIRRSSAPIVIVSDSPESKYRRRARVRGVWATRYVAAGMRKAENHDGVDGARIAVRRVRRLTMSRASRQGSGPRLPPAVRCLTNVPDLRFACTSARICTFPPYIAIN